MASLSKRPQSVSPQKRKTKKKTKATPTFFQVVPDSEEEWSYYAGEARVDYKTLGEHTNFKSASEIDQTQFLLLRTIVKKYSIDQFNPEKFGLQDSMDKAKKMLKISTGFQSYLKAIEKDTMGGTGHFSEVRNHQEELLWTGADYGERTKTDESSVNTPASVLLKSFQSVIPGGCRYSWRAAKMRFQATFVNKFAPPQSKHSQPGYTAFTDGQLQDRSHEYDVKALLECKPDSRCSVEPAVDMQEAAQKVAWIREYPSESERQ